MGPAPAASAARRSPSSPVVTGHGRGWSTGRPAAPDDLTTISPYITHVIRRFGNWILNLTPPAAAPTTHLDLESRVLFAP
ncbi:hypothetical protein [Sphaerisporangium aureirubrum]|uniref:Uncharacterized protein n=1 Tax=Sphaerisporangium aureirubrum TaxID=1544736 RepID=A0ABW1NYG8_9ACTN